MLSKPIYGKFQISCIGAIMVLAALVPSCKPRQFAVPRLLLLDTRLERTVSARTEVVSRVRFIAKSHAATAVFLPAGDRFGIGVAFVPFADEKTITLTKAVYAERYFAEDVLGDYNDWPSKFVMASGGESTTFTAKLGQDITCVKGGKGRNGVDVDYRVIVNCERMVERAALKHVESSLFRLNGERLHQVNVAIPKLLSAGVELNFEDAAR
ncbi:MAG: hypothetical protein GWN67_14385 [Phycisphaerae bacterium]|nr:hypothetical protein [Phycisphaerae bacterium]NIP53321.1 hypothetical protein [Phycisphaerae bacterium]NIS49956.1 hypothetical protein [Phycisphaerae bacterium]NIU07660.1 hypothetical protein [Phycisphaerae bacterium]NIU57525.1 hypothetical protein [Phycisphaerae bacterium]